MPCSWGFLVPLGAFNSGRTSLGFGRLNFDSAGKLKRTCFAWSLACRSETTHGWQVRALSLMHIRRATQHFRRAMQPSARFLSFVTMQCEQRCVYTAQDGDFVR
eukprot:scaffold7392_cov286-Pinguiococcus_pyrenoidosus.AAC.24